MVFAVHVHGAVCVCWLFGYCAVLSAGSGAVLVERHWVVPSAVSHTVDALFMVWSATFVCECYMWSSTPFPERVDPMHGTSHSLLASTKHCCEHAVFSSG